MDRQCDPIQQLHTFSPSPTCDLGTKGVPFLWPRSLKAQAFQDEMDEIVEKGTLAIVLIGNQCSTGSCFLWRKASGG